MTGSGTQSDPYIIYDLTDLQEVENDLGAYYELGNDIDASGTSSGTGFAGIGYMSGLPFTGSLDGKGFSIIDLYGSGGHDGGILFWKDEGATVKNLKMENVHGGRVGTCAFLSGISKDSHWSDCGIEGDLTIPSSFADSKTFSGFIAKVDGGTIEDCYLHADIDASAYTGDYCYTAGFIGVTENAADIKRCYFVGEVTGTDSTIKEVAAFCTDNPSSAIVSCYYDEDVATPSDDFATGLSTTQMKNDFYYTDWDFVNDWFIVESINSGYPELYALETPPEIYEGGSAVEISIASEASGIANMIGSSEPTIVVEEEGLGTIYTHPTGTSTSSVIISTEGDGEEATISLEATQVYNKIFLSWS